MQAGWCVLVGNVQIQINFGVIWHFVLSFFLV